MELVFRHACAVALLLGSLAAPQSCLSAPAPEEQSLSAMMDEVWTALQSRKHARAKELLAAVLARAPNNLKALQLLGATERELGNKLPALAAYAKALAVAPGDEYSTD